MNEHVTDQLSAYLDDELNAAARGAVEIHLRACVECATTLDELRRVVIAAGQAAAHDTPPARDLWTGILAGIREHGAEVAAFTTAAAKRARKGDAPVLSAVEGRRRITLSMAQLAAAAALLVAVSGATAWFLRGSAAPESLLPAAALIPVEIEPDAAPDTVRLANFADAQYDAAIADLERALLERRNDLNPRTVEILERNLKLIDAAIAQARQALEEDPANTYLNRHLSESRHRKLELLRRATAITEAD